MKKLIAITFIFLAGIFCFKSIITYMALQSDSICIIMDICEKESSEKEDIDGKSDTEEFLSSDEDLSAINSIYKNIFRHHIVSGYFTPYFDINSPPPEFNS